MATKRFKPTVECATDAPPPKSIASLGYSQSTFCPRSSACSYIGCALVDLLLHCPHTLVFWNRRIVVDANVVRSWFIHGTRLWLYHFASATAVDHIVFSACAASATVNPRLHVPESVFDNPGQCIEVQRCIKAFPQLVRASHLEFMGICDKHTHNVVFDHVDATHGLDDGRREALLAGRTLFSAFGEMRQVADTYTRVAGILVWHGITALYYATHDPVSRREHWWLVDSHRCDPTTGLFTDGGTAIVAHYDTLDAMVVHTLERHNIAADAITLAERRLFSTLPSADQQAITGVILQRTRSPHADVCNSIHASAFELILFF